MALVQDLVTLLQKYPGVQMKTVTRPRLRNAGKRPAGSPVPSFNRLVVDQAAGAPTGHRRVWPSLAA